MYARELAVAERIAKEAGHITLEMADSGLDPRSKHNGELVTAADIKINKNVIAWILDEFPEDNIIGEEDSTSGYGQGRRWICDPVDGTVALLWGIPTPMFSLALCVDGRPVMAVAYSPYLARLYRATVDTPSQCNGEAVHVSDKGLNDGVVGVNGDVYEIFEHGNALVAAIVARGGTPLVAINGAVFASCLVASGRLVGYCNSKVQAHDMAAVDLIVEQAGGRVTGMDGRLLDYSKPFRGAIVSNGRVHDMLVAYATRNVDGAQLGSGAGMP